MAGVACTALVDTGLNATLVQPDLVSVGRTVSGLFCLTEGLSMSFHASLADVQDPSILLQA